MLTLLSPAKKLDMTPVETGIQATSPRLDVDTRELASVAKTQTADDLKRLMRISDELAEVNFERFQSFDLDNRSNSAKPAGLAFDGDVYWGLEAKTLSEGTLAYAQDHLRILSGLYGVLRPMDLDGVQLAFSHFRLGDDLDEAVSGGRRCARSEDFALHHAIEAVGADDNVCGHGCLVSEGDCYLRPALRHVDHFAIALHGTIRQ